MRKTHYGNPPETILKRSILKHIKKNNKKVITRANVGVDFAAISCQSNQETIISNGFSVFSTFDEGIISYIKAKNNFDISGGTLDGINLFLMLPKDIREIKVKKIMEKFNEIADNQGINILGGHTEYSDIYKKITVAVTLIGHREAENASIGLDKRDKIKVKDKIIMTKYAGLLGTNIISHLKQEELTKRFSQAYSEKMQFSYNDYFIMKEALIAKNNKCKYMHDVSSGGVFSGLWQLSEAINRGIIVDIEKIPIMQETVELCEFFHLNPYEIDGTGSLIIVANDEESERIIQNFQEHNICACIIGEITDNNDRLIINRNEKRYLSPVNGDEIYKIY